jgi:Phage derived protein Gp49-like (DUF891)
MAAKKITVAFFATETGAMPVRDWLLGMSSEDRKKIGEDIKTVEFGWPVGMPVCRPLGKGLYEARTNLKDRIARVLHGGWRQDGFAPRLHQKIAGNAGQRIGLRAVTHAKLAQELNMAKKKNPHLGSSFDDFLKEEGIYEEVTAAAMKRLLAWQIAQAMKKQRLTKSVMAKRMRTSRAALDRLLDAQNTSVTLQTMGRAAAALGKQLSVTLKDAA